MEGFSATYLLLELCPFIFDKVNRLVAGSKADEANATEDAHSARRRKTLIA
jgi:hypothetical protein